MMLGGPPAGVGVYEPQGGSPSAVSHMGGSSSASAAGVAPAAAGSNASAMGALTAAVGAAPAEATGSVVSGARVGARAGVTTGARAGTKAGAVTGAEAGAATGAVEGVGAASPAVFERRHLVGDPGAAAGRREDKASLVAWSSDNVRPKDAAVACAMSTARNGSLLSLSLVLSAVAAVATRYELETSRKRRRG
jgi:hypothetical protein